MTSRAGTFFVLWLIQTLVVVEHPFLTWSQPWANHLTKGLLFHFTALVWESSILVLASLTCKAYPIAILLHDHCAIYTPPPTPPLCMSYTMQYW